MAALAHEQAVPDIEIVIPVYNEQDDLATSVVRLHRHLRSFPFSARITIADNASTDATWAIARGLAASLSGVGAVHLAEKGRGRALRAVWQTSDATVVAYRSSRAATT
jgi:glycosyltransferase involved in cell wall biosynthesis